MICPTQYVAQSAGTVFHAPLASLISAKPPAAKPPASLSLRTSEPLLYPESMLKYVFVGVEEITIASFLLEAARSKIRLLAVPSPLKTTLPGSITGDFIK